MDKEKSLIAAHPQGEVEIARNQAAETVTSLDTFAGKVHVKWSPEATGEQPGPDAILHRVSQDQWAV